MQGDQMKLYSLVDTSHLNTPDCVYSIPEKLIKLWKNVCYSVQGGEEKECLHLDLHQKLAGSVLGRDPSSIQVLLKSGLWFFV